MSSEMMGAMMKLMADFVLNIFYFKNYNHKNTQRM
jgi:hypothetical protein